MINPTGDEFNEEVPTSASADVGAFQPRNRSAAETASEAWEQTKEKAGAMKDTHGNFCAAESDSDPARRSGRRHRDRARDPLRFNHSYQEDEPREKIGDGALGFLSLPFLLPLLKSVKTKAEDSADALKEGVDRLKNVNVSRYTKPIRKHWKAWTK